MSEKLTITEALADVKTIKARIGKKRGTILQYLVRDCRVRDPLERDGGTIEYVQRERQGIADLEARLLRIRNAIQESNLNTGLTLHGVTRSLADWLSWRRQISTEGMAFTTKLIQTVARVREQASKDGLKLTDRDTGQAVPEIVVAISETKLAEEAEEFEALLGDLDGQLSLLNATTVVDVS
jgi:hypothetical protein